MRSDGEAVCGGRTPGAREAKDQEMISLILRDVPYEQDVRELFMAFYPGERYTHEADENAMISFTAEHSAEDAARYALTLAVRGKAESCFSSPCTADRRQTKDELKRALYRQLSEATGKKLPWGTLTGIRPTKLALTELRKGKSEEQVRQKLKEQYYLSDERNSLCVRTASHELQAMQGLNLETGWSLYIGIPFCPSICLYCSFGSHVLSRWEHMVDPYLDALIKELIFISENMKDYTLDTIYIGGGTPTTLNAAQMERLLTKVTELFPMEQVQEFTVEAGRPDTINEEVLKAIRKFPVTRISINPQTMNQETLDLIEEALRQKHFLVS